tara:strand:- start:514 stop:1575 length:1062 start_codon:yes stop_codon:yes gene_type:complete
MSEILRKQFEQNLKISEPKSKTIPTINRWNKIDEKFKKIEKEEFSHDFKKKLKVKKKRLRQILKERRKKREKKYKKKNYDKEEEEKTREKARKLAADSQQFFLDYEKQQEQNPFFDSDDEDVYMRFGKKQKKDIKGMIKKILLYGGLPTLLVVSLGVLSNKKFGKGKIKKKSKIKVSEEEKRFKQVFVKKLKKIILKRKQELNSMEKDSKENEFATNKREINRQTAEQQIKRDLIANAAMNRMNPLEIKKPSSNPQQAVETPKRKALIETIQERMKKKIPSNKVFLKIDNNNKKWSFEEEKNSNYYISKGDGKIYNKTTGNPSSYVYTKKNGLGKITMNNVVRFIKTEQLKKD